MFRQYTKLPASVYIIVLASLVNSMGNFVRPFLTIFLTDRLGLSSSDAGVIVTISISLYVPAALIGGKLVDTFGRKKVLVIFNSLSALAFLICGISFNPVIFVVLILCSSFAISAASPASSAMMADITNEENRKAAFSLQYLGSNLGFALGPMIAGFLYKNYTSLIFFGDALTTILSLALIVKFVPDTMPKKENTLEMKLPDKEQFEEGNALGALLKRPYLLMLALISILYSFVYCQHVFSLPIQLNGIYKDLGPKYFGVLMSTNALTVVLCSTVITSLTSKFKSIYNISLAGIFYAVGFGMIFFVNSILLLILSTFIWSIGEILTAVNTKVFIADNTPASHRGRFNAIIETISGTGFAMGPWVTGLLLNQFEIRWMWAVSFAAAAIGAAFMYSLHLFESKVGTSYELNR